MRLLDTRERFAKDTKVPFFMYNYLSKIRLRAEVVCVPRLECSLTTGDVTSQPIRASMILVPHMVLMYHTMCLVLEVIWS